MTITAHIHGLPDGRIADDSTIEIEGTHYLIPARVEVGGSLAPHRIAAALEKAGYRQATPGNQLADLDEVDADGVREIRVVKA